MNVCFILTKQLRFPFNLTNFSARASIDFASFTISQISQFLSNFSMLLSNLSNRVNFNFMGLLSKFLAFLSNLVPFLTFSKSQEERENPRKIRQSLFTVLLNADLPSIWRDFLTNLSISNKSNYRSLAYRKKKKFQML